MQRFTLVLLVVAASCLPALAVNDVCNGAIRVECGWDTITREECIAEGCCFEAFDPKEQHYDHGVPWCFRPSAQATYKVVEERMLGRDGLPGVSLALDLVNAHGVFGPDAPKLWFTATFETNERIRVQITDRDADRYEVPAWILPIPESPGATDAAFTVAYESEPFGFAITRKLDGEVVFDTRSDEFSTIIFGQQYVELTTRLPADPVVYGIGERVQPLKLDSDDMTFAMHTLDEPSATFNHNLYGYQPIYMEMRGEGHAHGFLMRSSYSGDVVLNNANGQRLTWRLIGGNVDFYMFSGPSPNAIVSQIQDVVGKPWMPPYWSQGFHLCKYGFSDLDEVKTVFAEMEKARIPVDTYWIDIDHMNKYEIFTFDEEHFPAADVAEFQRKLHANGNTLVLIVDPAVRVQEGYGVYERGLKADAFVKDFKNDVFVGSVWPGLSAFPDFMDRKVHQWWQDELEIWLRTVPVDGIWLDMNEPASFCHGACEPRDYPPPQWGEFNPHFPAYQLFNKGRHEPLRFKTLDMDAIHADNTIHYKVHNLYGIAESIATYDAMRKLRPGKRPFLLSRSTFPGSGRVVGTWLGDNAARWADLQLSIAGTITHSLFGIPYSGPDICGFIGDAWEELCARWMTLGAFYPFSRNHKATDTTDQWPYLWQSVAEGSRKALGVRYAMLPLYNTLHFEASTKTGSVMRALSFEFPSDKTTWSLDEQFLIGSDVLVSPVVHPGVNHTRAYFPPAAKWVNFYTGKDVAPDRDGWKTLVADWTEVPVHIRRGAALVLQPLGTALNSRDGRKKPFKIVCAPTQQSSLGSDVATAGVRAQGSVYLDDGVSEDLELGVVTKVSLVRAAAEAEAKSGLRWELSAVAEALAHHQEGSLDVAPLGEVEIWGVGGAGQISRVTANGQTANFTATPENDSIAVHGLHLRLDSPSVPVAIRVFA